MKSQDIELKIKLARRKNMGNSKVSEISAGSRFFASFIELKLALLG